MDLCCKNWHNTKKMKKIYLGYTEKNETRFMYKNFGYDFQMNKKKLIVFGAFYSLLIYSDVLILVRN